MGIGSFRYADSQADRSGVSQDGYLNQDNRQIDNDEQRVAAIHKAPSGRSFQPTHAASLQIICSR